MSELRRTACGSAMAVAFLGACGGTVVTPQRPLASPVEVIPESLPRGPYSALLNLPQTLHYVVDESRGVACHLTDAGISGVTRAFKVDCEGAQASAPAQEPTTPGAWCLSDTYFGGIPSAPGAWRTDGCYVVAPEGLWHLATCPATRGTLADLAAAGGVLVLGADGLPHAAVQPGEATRASRTVDGVGAVEAVCVDADDAGMMKAMHTQVCTSPVYAYLESNGTASEMERVHCRGSSKLVAVEPGLQPARGCLLEPAFVGAWSVVAKTYVGAAGKAAPGRVGGVAHYQVVVARDATCALTATVSKVGEGGKRLGPKKVSSGTAPVGVGCGAANHACVTTKVALKDATGRTDELTLAWSLARGEARPALTGYWSGGGSSGLVQGGALDADAALTAFDDAAVPPETRCEAVATRSGPKGERIVDVDRYQACLHDVR